MLGFALTAQLAVSCGRSDESSGDNASTRTSDNDASWRTGLGEGKPASVLAALLQTHRSVRDALGPHELQYTSTIAVEPSAPTTEPPPVGALAVRGDSVRDSLSLLWAGADEAGPRFQLLQSNDHDRGRDVVVLDGRMYVQLMHRPFTVQPVESDVHELWLDDALHAVGDAVAFVAPAAAMQARAAPGEGLLGGDAVVVSLELGESPTPPADAAAGEAWRQNARFTEISGSIRIDAATGVWLEAELAAAYEVADAEGNMARGSLNLAGTLKPRSGDATPLAAPADAKPLPERERYEVERARILDGLAAP